MELTRRDALAALAAVGGGGAAGYAASRASSPDDGGRDDSDDGAGVETGESVDGSGDGAVDDATVRTVMVAAAEVVYPDEVEGTAAFVGAFLDGRLDREGHAGGVREAVATLDDRARTWHGAPFADLSSATRDRLLREVGADTAEERPDGTDAERVRYYVVNELLLGLYASPAGGELVGIENPQGHPGGLDTYQRGPPSR